MGESWKLPPAARWWLGVGVPLALLLLAGLSFDWQAGARVGGGLSVFLLTVTTLLLATPATPRLDNIGKVLLLTAIPFGVFVWGAEQGLLLVAAATVTLLAGGAMLLFRRDPVAAFCIMLGWMAFWVILFFGIFGDWPSAAIWGGGLVFGTVAVYFGGRLAQGCTWQQEIPFALYLAAAPVGCVFWGAGVEYGFASFLGFLVAAAGVLVKIATKDWVNEEP